MAVSVFSSVKLNFSSTVSIDKLSLEINTSVALKVVREIKSEENKNFFITNTFYI
jgi:hypothetical protein